MKRFWGEFSKAEMEESLYHFYPFLMKWAALQGISDNLSGVYRLYQITCEKMSEEWELLQKFRDVDKKIQ